MSQLESNVYYKLFSGGLPAILYESVADSNQVSNVSSVCRSSLNLVHDALIDNRGWAFRFLDSSSRAPQGLLDGTMVGLGDFDQCLALDSPAGRGSHCITELRLIHATHVTDDLGSVGSELGGLYPLKDFFSPLLGLCVPSTCSSSDVYNMMSSTLAGQPFGISSHVSCQTMQDDTSLSTAQLMSIAFLTTLVLLVISGSLLNRVPWSSSFSIVSNGKSLFRKNSNRSQVVDLMKLGFALLFISMHSVVGSDNPYGPVMVSRLTEALRDTEKVMFQILFSDSLVEVMFLMCGFTAVYTLYPRIAKGPVKLGNVLKLLFDKWSRTVPLIMGLIALEFVWPLIGSGPLFKLASDFTVSNCYKYWLLNVLQVGNWSPAIEKCAPQLFHSSVDFQLFAMAVPLTLLLARKPRLGFALAAILTLGSSIYVAYIVQLKQIIPNFVARDASVQKMMQFMDEVHQPTYTHMPAYIIGMLMGYKAVTKTRIDLPVKVTKTLKILCGLAFVAAIFGPTIHNTFQLLPKEAVGLYVIGQKLLYICGLFPILLASSKEEARGEKKRPNKDKDDNLARSDKDVTDRDEYSLVSALCKLTFSLYLMNYYCIRYDFLTSRIPFQAGVYHVQKRFIFSLVLTFLVATLFHLIVIAPFDNLRKKYYSMAITSPEPVADKMAEHDPRGVAKAIQLKEKGA